jgi:hypothetical protein
VKLLEIHHSASEYPHDYASLPGTRETITIHRTAGSKTCAGAGTSAGDVPLTPVGCCLAASPLDWHRGQAIARLVMRLTSSLPAEPEESPSFSSWVLL